MYSPEHKAKLEGTVRAAGEERRPLAVASLRDFAHCAARLVGGLGVVLVGLAGIQAVQAAAPTAGLIGYWNFDDAGGTIAADSSGRGNHGTLTNGPTWTTGKINGALSFDGVNDYVAIPNESQFDFTTTFTVSLWMKTPGFTKAWASIISKGDSAWSITRYNTTGNADFNTFSPGANDLPGTINVANNQWRHLVAIYNGAVKQLYVDGVLNASVTLNQPLSTNNFPVRIGHNSEFTSAYFNGVVDEVRIYSRALTAQEVADIFNDGGVPLPPDTSPPTVPSGLTATATSTTQISLTWGAAADNVGVTGYRVFRGGVQIATVAGTSYGDSSLAPLTTYSYQVAAADAAGNVSPLSAAASATTLAPSAGDTVLPSVAITAPTASAVLRGSAVTVSATASDNVGVIGVQMYLDGAKLGAEDTVSPYSVTWNTTQTTSGTHVLTASARDAAGNLRTSVPVSVTVDNVAPTGSVAINNNAPATNNRTVILSLSASDAHSAVTQMRFSNTGTSYSTAEPFAPTKNWTLSAGAGTKNVFVQFRDTAGNWSSGISDSIVLDTTAPTLTGIAPTAINANSAAITWTSSEPATSRVEYGPTISYGLTTALDPTLLTAHSVAISNLSPGTTYNYRVRSSDAAANEAVSGNNTFLTLAVPDAEAPTVPTGLTATAPSSSRVSLAWIASTDNVGVAGYRVFRNGSQAGTAPGNSYSDTGVSPETLYTYMVAAYDAAGNVSGLSAPVAVTTPPAPPGPAPRLSADGSFVIDQNDNGKPFFFNGDTAWSLIAQLSREDAELYLADRQQKGFNFILTSLIEHEFATNAPANFYGSQPFTTAGNFAMPNEAYFAHADWVIANAASKGQVVLLVPLYLGSGCGGQGWCAEVNSNSTANVRGYGRYLGSRYSDFPNIVWVIGGDTDPSPVVAKLREFVAGIKEFDTVHLMTAHNARGQAAVDPWPNETWLDLNNIYTSGADAAEALQQYNRVPFKPFFLIEAGYENEGSDGSGLRSQAYTTVLSGGYQGHLFGNCPIWAFAAGVSAFCSPSDWKGQLNSEGSRTLALVGRLFASRAFHKLVPDQDHTVVTAGFASPVTITARANDGSSVFAYMPTGHSVTVNMTKVSGASANAWWFDPRTGAATSAGSALPTTGSRVFAAPSSGDWVLVLDDASLNLDAPGS